MKLADLERGLFYTVHNEITAAPSLSGGAFAAAAPPRKVAPQPRPGTG